MTKLLFALLLFLGPTVAYADDSWRASYMAPAPALPRAHGVAGEAGTLMLLTYYSCSVAEKTERCLTSSGVRPEVGMVAALELPLGTVLLIEGKGLHRVTDRGGLGPRQLDVYTESYEDAIQAGVQERVVWIR